MRLTSPRLVTLPRAALAGAALLAACGHDEGGHDHGDDGDSVNCAIETTKDDLVIGFSRDGAGGLMRFELVGVTPAPPARGDNEWTIAVSAVAGGAAVSGATIFVTPFMPAHQHGTPIDAVVTPEATAGRYKLAPVNLWMPGLWETTIEVESAAGNDTVVFRVCIPG